MTLPCHTHPAEVRIYEALGIRVQDRTRGVNITWKSSDHFFESFALLFSWTYFEAFSILFLKPISNKLEDLSCSSRGLTLLQLRQQGEQVPKWAYLFSVVSSSPVFLTTVVWCCIHLVIRFSLYIWRPALSLAICSPFLYAWTWN